MVLNGNEALVNCAKPDVAEPSPTWCAWFRPSHWREFRWVDQHERGVATQPVVDLGARVEAPPGTLQFTDPDAMNQPRRYYRVQSP